MFLNEWCNEIADSKENMEPSTDELSYRVIELALLRISAEKGEDEDESPTASVCMDFIYELNRPRFDEVRRRIRKRRLLENGVPEKRADQMVEEEFDYNTLTN